MHQNFGSVLKLSPPQKKNNLRWFSDLIFYNFIRKSWQMCRDWRKITKIGFWSYACEFCPNLVYTAFAILTRSCYTDEEATLCLVAIPVFGDIAKYVIPLSDMRPVDHIWFYPQVSDSDVVRGLWNSPGYLFSRHSINIRGAVGEPWRMAIWKRMNHQNAGLNCPYPDGSIKSGKFSLSLQGIIKHQIVLNKMKLVINGMICPWSVFNKPGSSGKYISYKNPSRDSPKILISPKHWILLINVENFIWN